MRPDRRWTRQCLLHSEVPRSQPPLVRSSRSFRSCLRARGLRRRSCSSMGHGMARGAGTNSFSIYFAAHGFEAHALSLRAHGASEGRAQLHRCRIRHYVEDVEAVAAALPTSPILVGHSMGGFVVQKFLETHLSPAAFLLASIPPERGAVDVCAAHARSAARRAQGECDAQSLALHIGPRSSAAAPFLCRDVTGRRRSLPSAVGGRVDARRPRLPSA